MSLKADILKTNPNKLKAIMKEVTSILGHIDDEIKTAYETDCNDVVVSVPITYSIPYMSNRNAQRIIYYKILDSLLERGYHVNIHMEPDRTVFYIKWLSNEEEQEADIQNALLAKHTVKSLPVKKK